MGLSLLGLQLEWVCSLRDLFIFAIKKNRFRDKNTQMTANLKKTLRTCFKCVILWWIRLLKMPWVCWICNNKQIITAEYALSFFLNWIFFWLSFRLRWKGVPFIIFPWIEFIYFRWKWAHFIVCLRWKCVFFIFRTIKRTFHHFGISPLDNTCGPLDTYATNRKCR